jgi:hypothetical protein
MRGKDSKRKSSKPEAETGRNKKVERERKRKREGKDRLNGERKVLTHGDGGLVCFEFV